MTWENSNLWERNIFVKLLKSIFIYAFKFNSLYFKQLESVEKKTDYINKSHKDTQDKNKNKNNGKNVLRYSTVQNDEIR